MDAILADYADEIYSEGNHKKDSYYKTLGPKAIFMNERSNIDTRLSNFGRKRRR